MSVLFEALTSRPFIDANYVKIPCSFFKYRTKNAIILMRRVALHSSSSSEVLDMCWVVIITDYFIRCLVMFLGKSHVNRSHFTPESKLYFALKLI